MIFRALERFLNRFLGLKNAFSCVFVVLALGYKGIVHKKHQRDRANDATPTHAKQF